MLTIKDMVIPEDVSPSDKLILTELLSKAPNDKSPLEQIWYLMDYVWDEMNLNNKNVNLDLLSQFYLHPIWLLNGLFIESHELSLLHRQSITHWVLGKLEEKSVTRILEVGGGFGTLARLLALNTFVVEVLEPYPNSVALSRSSKYSNITYVSEPCPPYDALIAMDVMEHLIEPIDFLRNMVKWVKLDGFLIFQNHFAPCIKCHLPSTFYLSFGFESLANLFGLEKVENIENSGATVYKKVSIKSPNQFQLTINTYKYKSYYFYRKFRNQLRLKHRIKSVFFFVN